MNSAMEDLEDFSSFFSNEKEMEAFIANDTTITDQELRIQVARLMIAWEAVRHFVRSGARHFSLARDQKGQGRGAGSVSSETEETGDEGPLDPGPNFRNLPSKSDIEIGFTRHNSKDNRFYPPVMMADTTPPADYTEQIEQVKQEAEQLEQEAEQRLMFEEDASEVCLSILGDPHAEEESEQPEQLEQECSKVLSVQVSEGAEQPLDAEDDDAEKSLNSLFAEQEAEQRLKALSVQVSEGAGQKRAMQQTAPDDNTKRCQRIRFSRAVNSLDDPTLIHDNFAELPGRTQTTPASTLPHEQHPEASRGRGAGKGRGGGKARGKAIDTEDDPVEEKASDKGKNDKGKDEEKDADDWNMGDYWQGIREHRPESPEGMEWLPAGDMCLYRLHPKAKAGANSTD